MHNLGRALRLTLRYRFRLAAAMFCALMVGLLWGANIGTVYPLIEIVTKGQSPVDWVEGEIERSQTRIAEARLVLGVTEARRLVAEQKPDAARERLDSALAELTANAELTAVIRAPLEARLQALGKSALAGQPAGPKETIEAGRAEQQIAAETNAIGKARWMAEHVITWLPNDAFKTVVVVVVMLFVGTIVKGIFLVANTILTTSVVGLATHELRNQFYRRTLRMDQATFTNEGVSDLMSRFTFDMESLSAGLRLLTSSAVLEPLKMICCLAGAAFVSWRLLLFSLIIAPLGFFFMQRLAASLKTANRRAAEGMSRIYGILNESFSGIAVVKAFTMERIERRRFHLENKSYYHKTMKIGRYDALTNPVTEWIGILTISVTLLAGLYLAINQRTHLLGIPLSDRPPGIGELLLFYGLLAGTSDPLRKLSGIMGRIQRAAASADRIYALIDRDPQIVDPPQPRKLPRHWRSLEFVDVSFGYRPGIPVLDGISLKLNCGERIALVGPNGCGKSTLASLVSRFYDPQEGQVLLDGTDLRDVRQRDLRGQIGLVTQEPVLFNDTVFNNIRYGAPHATREQVAAAAQAAHAHRFIQEKLPHGYDTIVGERGSTLSGGQRQRIALARAILRDPSILILDEATSQVDVESEQLIHMALREFVRGRTTIFITHRVSTLELVDRVVVLDHGRIVDDGTHAQLTSRCGFYQRLFREAA